MVSGVVVISRRARWGMHSVESPKALEAAEWACYRILYERRAADTVRRVRAVRDVERSGEDIEGVCDEE
jgi:hypothetical protein